VLNSSARASSATVDTGHVGAYAGRSAGAWNVRTGAEFAWSSVSTNRSIVFPGFSEVASASYNVGLAQVFGEVGYGVALGNIAAEPFAGLAYVHLHSGSFAESGGLAALSGANGDQDVGYSMLGARLATSWVLPNGPAVTPRVSAAWQHAFGDVTPAAALTFQTLGTSFNIAGVPLARDAAVVDAGFDVRVTPQLTLALSYFGKLAGNAEDHSVKGTFAYRF
jgi:outer membrane autotransporter protein